MAPMPFDQKLASGLVKSLADKAVHPNHLTTLAPGLGLAARASSPSL